MCNLTKLGMRRTEGRAARSTRGWNDDGSYDYSDDELRDMTGEELEAALEQGDIDQDTYDDVMAGEYDEGGGFFDNVSAGDIVGAVGSVANAFGSIFNAFRPRPEPVPQNIRPRIERGERPERPAVVAQPAAGGGAGELVTKVFSSPLTYLGAAGTVAMQVLAPQQQTIVKALPILAGVGAVAYDTFATKPRSTAGRPPAPNVLSRVQRRLR